MELFYKEELVFQPEIERKKYLGASLRLGIENKIMYTIT